MQHIKKILKISLLSLLFLAKAGFAQECILEVGYHTQPPILYDENNKIMGLDAELVELIAKKAECKIKWVNVPWARAQAMMKDGTLFMSTNALDTPERRGYATMLAYRPDTPNRLFAKEETVKSIKATSLKEFLDLTNKKIGVVVGYQYDDEIEALMKDPAYASKFERIPDQASNLDKLMSDRTNGFIMEQLLGNYFIKQQDLQSKIGRYDFSFGFDPNRQAFIMLSKKADPQGVMTAKVIKAINELRDSKEYKTIINNYFN